MACEACNDLSPCIDCRDCCPEPAKGFDACDQLTDYYDKKVKPLSCYVTKINLCNPCVLVDFLRDMLNKYACLLGNMINSLCFILNMLKGLDKIVKNLYKSGAITTDDPATFEFKPGRDIATGNINLFGGTADGDHFIRTNSGSTEDDITAGI